MANIPSSPSTPIPTISQPASATPTVTLRQPLLRAVSTSSASWTSDAPHHNQGTSYFSPVSPKARRVSTRNNSMARSVSMSSERHPEGDMENAENNDSNDEIPSPEDQNNGEEETDTERQFTEDDPLTVKDRQSLMNVDHPFGLPIWKPALYKKSRSVNRYAETALHAIPSSQRERLYAGNIAWTIFFGWWLSIVCIAAATVLFLVPFGGLRYGKILIGLGWYLFWPFGKYVAGKRDSAMGATSRQAEETTENIHSIPEVDENSENLSSNTEQRDTPQSSTSSEQNQDFTERTRLKSGRAMKSYTQSFMPSKASSATLKFANDELGKVVFWSLFFCLIAPLILSVCLICWFFVITVPMAKLNWRLLTHIFRQSTDIRFCAAPPAVHIPPTDRHFSVSSERQTEFSASESDERRMAATKAMQLAGYSKDSDESSTVLLCIYRAVGLQYYKYTVGGVNIFFVNLMAVVFFAIFDGFFLLHLKEQYGDQAPFLLDLLTSRTLIFTLSLASVIPLSYFIGMAVASISAQSSIGMGAVINASFGSIIEIILYAIALTQGKGRLVEGSIVGSLLAGVLLLPGASMCSGALRKKEQKFNAKSAGVTSTMLIMAIIGTLTPTMFYQTYGSFQLVCDGCPEDSSGQSWLCDHCYYEHPDPIDDPFYQSTVKSYMYFCAVILLLSYLIGLWFSLRTHASQIWQNPQQLMHPFELQVPTSQGRTSIYQRLIPTALIPPQRQNQKSNTSDIESNICSRPETPVQRDFAGIVNTPLQINQASPSVNRRVTYSPVISAPIMESVNHAIKTNNVQTGNFPESMASDDFTRAVAVATVSALRHQQAHDHSPTRLRGIAVGGLDGHDDVGHAGGHDAPSWSRTTSASVLLSCTALYALIAEILVDVVDVVLEGSGLDEKFLGVTLFALVPNTTEFMNAMSFAMNGNIALSMEIGSAYALQVCLLQIPAMVAFSAWYDPKRMGIVADTFTLIFPRWDVIAIILSIFLLTYTYIEAKSNYHRGSILILSYVVLTAGFYFAPHRNERLDQFFHFLRQSIRV